MSSENVAYAPSPSDVGQSYVRLVVVSAVIVWSIINEWPISWGAFQASPLLLSFPFYILYCLIYLWLSYRFERPDLQRSNWAHVKRAVGLVIDLSSCALYLSLAGEYALVLYPIYVTVVIGYGLRYGLIYLYLAIFVGLLTFSGTVYFSPVFNTSLSLTLGFYLGLVLIPGYSAALLSKYQRLLIEFGEANAARARFIANISHELRTPLHAISGNAEVIFDVLSANTEIPTERKKLTSSASIIVDASDHLRTLVESVLDIASSDAGTYVLGEPERVDLIKLVKSAMQISKPGVRKPNIKFFLYIDPTVPRYVKTWEQQLKAVLINTAGNAVKYTENGTIHVKVTALHTQGLPGIQNILFEIIDTGIGISNDKLNSIYEPFFVGDDSRSRNYEGTGLGLPITKQYVDEMGGNMEIRSAVNQGTHISILLPIESILGPTSYSSRISIAIVRGQGSAGSLIDWITTVGWKCFELRDFDESIYHEFSGGTFDAILVEACLLHDWDELSLILYKAHPNTPRVLLGMPPEGIPIPDEFVTRVDPFNDEHLANLASLIGVEQARDPVNLAERRTVLVVDDNETNLRSAAIALESYGHSVECVSGGRDALAVLQSRPFDIVFMDMHMPEMSGVDVSKIYGAEVRANVPIVILTADATKAANVDSNIPEIAGFLTKPIKPSELQLAVLRYANKPQIGQRDSVSEMAIMTRVAKNPFAASNYQDLIDGGTGISAMISLTEAFENDARVQLRAIAEACENKCFEDCRRTLHKLKGSFAAMYIDSLVNIVEEYDALTIPDFSVALARDLDELEEAVSYCADSIREFLRSGSERTGFGVELATVT